MKKETWKTIIQVIVNYYSRSTGGHHQHGAISSDGLVVDVDAYYGIGTYNMYKAMAAQASASAKAWW